MNNFARIYKLANIHDNKVYIGFTTQTVNQRLLKHIRNSTLCERDTYLYNAIKKYGTEAFTIEEIYISKDVYHCKNIMENYFITEYKSFWKDGGYNMTLGGDGTIGHKHSEKTKLLMSESRKGKASLLTHSEETKKKIAENHSVDYILTNPIGTEFHVRGMTQFCKENNLNSTRMFFIVKSGGQHQGWKCKYADSNYKPAPILKTKEQKLKQCKTYNLIELKTNKSFVISNLAKFCEENNLSYWGMLDVSTGRQKQHRGFKCEKGSN